MQIRIASTFFLFFVGYAACANAVDYTCSGATTLLQCRNVCQPQATTAAEQKAQDGICFNLVSNKVDFCVQQAYLNNRKIFKIANQGAMDDILKGINTPTTDMSAYVKSIKDQCNAKFSGKSNVQYTDVSAYTLPVASTASTAGTAQADMLAAVDAKKAETAAKLKAAQEAEAAKVAATQAAEAKKASSANNTSAILGAVGDAAKNVGGGSGGIEKTLKDAGDWMFGSHGPKEPEKVSNKGVTNLITDSKNGGTAAKPVEGHSVTATTGKPAAEGHAVKAPDSSASQEPPTAQALDTHKDEATQSGKVVKDGNKQLSGKVDELDATAKNGGKEVAAETDISKLAKAKTEELLAAVKAAGTSAKAELTKFEAVRISEVTPDGKVTRSFPMTFSNANSKYAQAAQAEEKTFLLGEYIPNKKTCSQIAENTELVCVEGKSPIATGARIFMTVAAPALAAVTSIQGACSGTADVTDFVSKVLIVAKGVCLTAKVACSISCTTAHVKVKKKMADFFTELETAFTADKNHLQGMCASVLGKMNEYKAQIKDQYQLAGYEQVIKIVTNDCGPTAAIYKDARNVLTKYNMEIASRINQESDPIEGTVAGLKTRCDEKLRDVVSLGANIASLLVAKDAAKKCKEKLAGSDDTATSSASTLTTDQYCAQNSDSQFCKCQKDNSQQGCSGYTAIMSSTDALASSSLGGTSLRNTNGVSGFASGASTSAQSGKLPDFGVKAFGGGPNGDFGGSNSGSVDSPTVGSMGTMGTAGSEGGTAATGSAANNPATENKKWDFNSAYNGTGGSGSSGGGTIRVQGSKGNGDLNSSGTDVTEENVKRQIASERLADEISPASGKSNWEKIRRSYQVQGASFFGE